MRKVEALIHTYAALFLANIFLANPIHYVFIGLSIVYSYIYMKESDESNNF